ncbi:MAG: hypothetical protein VX599_06950 [Pseudomonadota bacterium]|nr:hypothetical protein [Pseudomonadota bacterium]
MEITGRNTTGLELPVHKAHIDLTAHRVAEAVADAWCYTPPQTKDGCGRINGDVRVVGDWLFSDVHLPSALYEIQTRRVLDVSPCLTQRLRGNSPKALLHGGNAFRQGTESLTQVIHGYLDLPYKVVTGGLSELVA